MYTNNLNIIVTVPETPGPISAVSGPKFAILWDVWTTYCRLTSFFPIVDTCFSCEDIARQSCTMVRKWRFFASFLRPVFSASRLQHISGIHSKFALRPHHVWKYGRHPISPAEIRRGKKEGRRRKIETTGQKYSVRICYAGWP